MESEEVRRFMVQIPLCNGGNVNVYGKTTRDALRAAKREIRNNDRAVNFGILYHYEDSYNAWCNRGKYGLSEM